MYDFSVIFGHRGEWEQTKAYLGGFSKLEWPKSKHNSAVSRAIDAVPYPTLYEDEPEFFVFATYVLAEANRQGVKLVWGGHWNSFKDYAHWELASDE